MNRLESDSSFVKVNLAEEPSPPPSGRQSPECDTLAEPAAAQPPPPPTTDAAPAPEAPLPAKATPSTADSVAAAPSPSSSTKDPVLREIEEVASASLAATRDGAAKLVKSAAEAKENLTSFVSSLWSALDPPTVKPAVQVHTRMAGALSVSLTINKNRTLSLLYVHLLQDIDTLKAHLGLDPTESVLESFRCKLIQAYRPATNTFTPSKTISFAAQLHIATASLCVELEGDREGRPVRVPAADIQSFAKQGDAVVISLVDGRSVVVGHFALPALEVDSALALLETLVPGETGGKVGGSYI
jgi:hypothetical protein